MTSVVSVAVAGPKVWREKKKKLYSKPHEDDDKREKRSVEIIKIIGPTSSPIRLWVQQVQQELNPLSASKREKVSYIGKGNYKKTKSVMFWYKYEYAKVV